MDSRLPFWTTFISAHSGNDLSISKEIIDLLEEYINKGHKVDRLDSDSLSLNNAIFILDTEKMKKQINNKNFDENGNLLESFAEELIQKSLHPDRVKKYLFEFNYDLLEDEYIEDQ